MGFLSSLSSVFSRGISAGSSDRSPWGSFWFNDVPMRMGGPVTAEGAMRLSAVYACVRVLAEAMAGLPLILYKQEANGGKTKVTDHWLHKLLCLRPNEFQNAFEWREMLMGHLALRGNAYCEIIAKKNGEITDLMPIHPDHIKIELLPNSDYRYRVRNDDGTEDILPRGSVWHIRGLSSNGIVGLSPLSLAAESFGVALEAQRYGRQFFANDAKPTSGWVEGGVFKDAEAKKTFAEAFQKAVTGANRHKILVLEGAMKYHEVGVTNKDAQFLELRKFQISDIARIFRVPPHMIGDLDRATFSNIEQQSLEFVIHTMQPWTKRWEHSIEYSLMPESSGLQVGFDFDELMRGDADSRSKYYASGITNGWLTRNEVRIRESLNPIDGLDEPLQPLNMIEADDAEEQEPDEKASENSKKPSESSQKDEEDDTKARLNELIRGNAARLARRIVRSDGFDAKNLDDATKKLIANTMVVETSVVDAWAAQGAPETEEEFEQSLMLLGKI